MTYYIGLDAHSKTCTGVVFDKLGKMISKAHFPTTEKELLGFVNSVPKPKVLAFEELNIAHWLYLLLKDEVDDLQIAHAPHLTKQRGAKTDFVDAVRLANELRLGTITRVYHTDSKLYDLRATLAAYQDFTKDLVRAKNRYKSFLRSKGLFKEGREVYKDEELVKSIEKAGDQFLAQGLFDQVTQMSIIKERVEKRIVAEVKNIPLAMKLCEIPGISYIRAALIVATVVDGDRFANKHKFWAYSMLVRHCAVSDGVTYGHKKAQGNRDLKTVFMGAAVSALQGTSSLRKYYDRLRSSGLCDRKAKKSVARKIASIALMTMKKGVAYDEHHFEKRSRTEKLN
jgi:transposase